ncbi:MAG TPA: helix-turn-helix domain-containing protein [Solirubrobacteraceae bacterium]|nr:helix-turn-helix domain-containing protein [Solirubrobacteraceae bacterium]
MATKRSYGDPCGVARALDLVGERWALLVVRELLLGPKRFTDLRAGLPHLSADVLSQRLRELEQVGVVRRSKLPPPAGSRVYELTDWGKQLEPVVISLGRWGSRAPFPDTDMPLGADALMIALKTVFDRSLVDGRNSLIEIVLGEDRFRASVAGDNLDIVRGAAERPDARIESDPATLAAVLWHGRAADDGALKIDGDRAAGERFLALFPAPQPARG